MKHSFVKPSLRMKWRAERLEQAKIFKLIDENSAYIRRNLVDLPSRIAAVVSSAIAANSKR